MICADHGSCHPPDWSPTGAGAAAPTAAITRPGFTAARIFGSVTFVRSAVGFSSLYFLFKTTYDFSPPEKSSGIGIEALQQMHSSFDVFLPERLL